MVYEGLLDLWKIKGLMVRDRTSLDHCPILVQGNHHNWGPKPFKLNVGLTMRDSMVINGDADFGNRWRSMGRSIFSFKRSRSFSNPS